jgi:hypothetical protein
MKKTINEARVALIEADEALKAACEAAERRRAELHWLMVQEALPVGHDWEALWQEIAADRRTLAEDEV